jgi:hypothetical protein
MKVLSAVEAQWARVSTDPCVVEIDLALVRFEWE